MKKKIMIVDDEEHILELIKAVLEQENYEVIVAHNGKECLDLLKKVKPDLILLDIMMPDIDGKEVCRKIRKNPLLRQLKIAFLTVIQSQDIDKEFMKELNVLDCITKPFSNGELLKKVKKILK